MLYSKYILWLHPPRLYLPTHLSSICGLYPPHLSFFFHSSSTWLISTSFVIHLTYVFTHISSTSLMSSLICHSSHLCLLPFVIYLTYIHLICHSPNLCLHRFVIHLTYVFTHLSFTSHVFIHSSSTCLISSILMTP